MDREQIEIVKKESPQRSVRSKEKDKSSRPSSHRSRESPSPSGSMSRSQGSRSQDLDMEDDEKSKPIEALIHLSAGFVDKVKDNKMIDKWIANSKVSKIEFLSSNESSSRSESKIVSVFDEDDIAKMQAVALVVDDIISYLKNPDRPDDDVEVSIYIPNRMVSQVIGREGRQINKIKADSKTIISVSKPSSSTSTRRRVVFTGRRENIQKAIAIVIDLVQSMMSKTTVRDRDRPSRPVPDMATKVKAKLVMSRKMSEAIIGDKGYFAKGLIKEFNVNIRIYEDNGVRCVKLGENILRISGKLQDAQDALVFIIRRANEYIQRNKYEKDMIKVLIPNTYVSNLIGRRGAVVRKIAARSCGAQIKILSSREQEREKQDCIVTVAGTLANKQDAVCIILEELEILRLQDLNRIKYRERSYTRSRSGSPKRRQYRRERSESRTRRESYHTHLSSKSPVRNVKISRSRSRSKDKLPAAVVQVEEPATVTNMIVVPEYLVKYFFENDSKIIKDIVDKTECKLTVCSKGEKPVNTPEGEPGRFIKLIGTPRACSDAFFHIQSEVARLKPSESEN